MPLPGAHPKRKNLRRLRNICLAFATSLLKPHLNLNTIMQQELTREQQQQKEFDKDMAAPLRTRYSAPNLEKTLNP